MKRYPLAQAQLVASRIMESVRPYTTKGSPVGSVRRREPRVKDIDLLFEVDEPVRENIEAITAEILAVSLWKKGGDRQISVSDVLGTGIDMDVFLSHPPANFFALLALRTGPWEKTQELVAALLDAGYEHPHASLNVASETEMWELAGLR